MKVKELIEKLREFDEDIEVKYDGNGSSPEIRHVEYEEYDDTVNIW